MKSFQFPVLSEEEAKHRHNAKLMVNDREFTLASDLTGIEVLEAVATGTTAAGGLRFLRRVIDPKDWDDFARLTASAEPLDFGEMIQEVINTYAGFPTTEESGSSSGSTTTGSTPPSDSPTPESTPAENPPGE